MTLDQLRTFFWVARLGGFRRASEQLNLSQPAVSNRVAALEAALRVRLFDRAASGLRMTKEGALLMTYAEQMLFVQEEIRRRVANPTEAEGLFRIGASETIAQSWLPDFLKTFSEAYPMVSIDLNVEISGNLRNGLLDRTLDLAFLMGPVSEYSVENLALPGFDLHWYKAADLGPVDIRAIPVISYSIGTRPHRELVTELSRRFGPGVRVYSSASLSASLQMITAGIAVGPYPRALAQPFLDAHRIAAFEPGVPLNPLAFTASYLGAPHSFLAESGAEMARDVAEHWAARDAS